MTSQSARHAWASMWAFFTEGEPHDRVQSISRELQLSPPLLKSVIHLGSVAENGGFRMSDLSRSWRCDASYVTVIVDGLEERGLAARRPHPTDRRVKTGVLTPEGRAMRDRAMVMISEPPSAFAALSAVERRQLRDLLRKLVVADPELAAKSIPA